MVTSFTKAAASELVARDLSVPPNMVGTLHSHCYRALGCPVIAETKVKEFNEENPGLSLSGKSASDLDVAIDEDVASGPNYGDKLMSRLQYYRNNLIPRDEWNTDVADFARVWEDFKRQTDTKDFTDLIEQSMSKPPSYAAVGFVDEAQDLTPLQFQLVRRWAQNFRKLVVCGDDDQALYRWAGASARSMLYPEVPEENKFFLDTTWRCPRVIQEYSARWVEQIVERQPKEQKTNRDIDGELVNAGYGYTNVMALIDDVEEDISNGKTAMILTSCSFQLAPVIRELKARGIPFWNKYRLTRGDWNPIRKATVSRILAFLQPEYGTLDDGSKVWSLKDIQKWGDIVKWRGIMPNGFMTAVDNVIAATEDASKSDVISAGIDFLDTWGVDKIMHADMNWLYENAKAGKDKSLEYPMTIIKKYGVDKLKEDPMTTVGTIHSVKGGESASVYLSPDLSKAAYRAAAFNQDCADDIVRQYYVGMTRASEKLTILQPTSQWHVKGLEI